MIIKALKSNIIKSIDMENIIKQAKIQFLQVILDKGIMKQNKMYKLQKIYNIARAETINKSLHVQLITKWQLMWDVEIRGR